MIQYEDLIKGYKQIQSQSCDIYKNLSKGQYPVAIVITCSDSRVDPALLMRCNPGDIFVTRNIANLVPAYDKVGFKHSSVGAVLKYGILHLGIKHIIVMGHSQCGGIKARLQSLESEETEEYISKWLEIVKPVAVDVLTKYPDESFERQAYICEQRSIVMSLNNLLTYPWIKEKVDVHELDLHGWYFDLSTTTISEFYYETQEFKELKV